MEIKKIVKYEIEINKDQAELREKLERIIFVNARNNIRNEATSVFSMLKCIPEVKLDKKADKETEAWVKEVNERLSDLPLTFTNEDFITVIKANTKLKDSQIDSILNVASYVENAYDKIVVIDECVGLACN